MTNFLTVEDINSILAKYGDVSTLHSINTSLIDGDIVDVMYDFCIINRTESNGQYTFTFDVSNILWCGGYYFTDTDGQYLELDGTINGNVITVTTNKQDLILVVYLTNLYTTFQFERLTWKSSDLKNLSQFYHHIESEKFTISMLDNSTPTGEVLFTCGELSETATIQDGQVRYVLESDNTLFTDVVKVTYDGCSYYIRPVWVKDVAPVMIEDVLVASKVNQVRLNIPTGFNVESGQVIYNGETITVDNLLMGFDLDLTDKINNRPVDLTLIVDETDRIMSHEYHFKVPCIFNQVSSFEELYVELNSDGGSRVMELSDDINFTGDIRISHDTKIIGNEYSFNLNSHSLILSEGVNLKIEEVMFNVGNPAIIQEVNSKLDATGCSFTGCNAENYNNLGSAIFCDIDLESLQDDDDFITNLTQCNFTNNHSCILHGGSLTVDKCTYQNNNTEYVDKNNPAFLYQIDGEAIITNSSFDIDYTDNTLCANQKNIGFAQAIYRCGLSAQVNTATHEYLQNNEDNLFVDAPYNNQCHLYAKYYYPKIESCVYSSPVLGREDKSFCYAISGVNWVFKHNVNVSRDEPNTNRVI